MRLHYRVKDNEIEILRCFGSDPTVILPEKVDGLPVTKAAPYAFSDRGEDSGEENGEAFLVCETEGHAMFSEGEHLLAGLDVEEIVFPRTVREIGNYIFYGCKRLKRLAFFDELKHIGSGAFTGCSELRSLEVQLETGNQTCVKEILGELWQRMDVVFSYHRKQEKAVLVFPEHYEEAVENTPARLLYTQHHGSGNNYRQCFYNKEMDYHKYDSLFSVAAVRDKVDVLADIALGRLGNPYELAPKDGETYRRVIRERYEGVLEYLIENDKFSGIRVYAQQVSWSEEMLEYAVELASRQRKTEILSYLMNERQKYFPKRRKRYEL